MTYRLALGLAAVLVVGLICYPAPASAQQSCEKLTSLALQNATVTSAISVAVGMYKPPAGPGQAVVAAPLPAFCRVAGVAKPTSDSQIKFEVWLPLSGWNGKFEQVGNGGYAGTIPLAAMATPLLRGYAAAATDDGHAAASNAEWAIGHPEKVIDFGYRAVHETSVQAQAIIQAFYGKAATRSYFVGCSDGGREALMEAQRYPADFIGIVAGSPAADWTDLQFSGVWNEQALHADAGSYIPPSKLKVLQTASLAACDTLDGVKDGLIQNPTLCHFNPAAVECHGADDSGCLTTSQVEAARKIYAGPSDPRTGAQVFPGFEPGTEGLPLNWQLWITGANPKQMSIDQIFGNQYFADMLYENPKWDYHTLNFDSDVTLAKKKLSALDAVNPDLKPFKARGGRLIQYHGWGDAAIAPYSSVIYFTSVQAAMGQTKHGHVNLNATRDFYRLFMVPGMSHCGGGAGANVFGNGTAALADADHDVVTALDRWVEDGTAPNQIIATRFTDNSRAKSVEMTRPLCPYPEEAHYKGQGDINDAANFVCQVPAKGGAN